MSLQLKIGSQVYIVRTFNIPGNIIHNIKIVKLICLLQIFYILSHRQFWEKYDTDRILGLFYNIFI